MEVNKDQKKANGQTRNLQLLALRLAWMPSIGWWWRRCKQVHH